MVRLGFIWYQVQNTAESAFVNGTQKVRTILLLLVGESNRGTSGVYLVVIILQTGLGAWTACSSFLYSSALSLGCQVCWCRVHEDFLTLNATPVHRAVWSWASTKTTSGSLNSSVGFIVDLFTQKHELCWLHTVIKCLHCFPPYCMM